MEHLVFAHSNIHTYILQIEMMKQSTARKVEMEESRLGLIIVEAYYGCFVTDERYI